MAQVLPTELIPDEEEGKILRVKMIQAEGDKVVDPVHLFDEGSTISWIPCGRKLTCSFPGIKFNYGPDEWCVLVASHEVNELLHDCLDRKGPLVWCCVM